jgi:hypothetical protein
LFFCYVAQADLELGILLPQPLKCWGYRHALLPLANKYWSKYLGS